MKKLTFKEVTFVTSSADFRNCPQIKDDSGELLPEIAVAGRSNVGKSSLLNHLFMSNKMVKVSQMPGKTRLLNFFDVDHNYLFCDLPGYGYAKVPGDTIALWKVMIEPYIKKRPNLKLVLLLLDIRRTPSEDDLAFYEWVRFHQRPVLCVLTKLDKLTKNEAKIQIQKIMQHFSLENPPHIEYSTTQNIGRKELIFEINRILTDGINEE